MVLASQVESFIKSVKEQYYGKDEMLLARISDSLFATSPGGGAVIYTKWYYLKPQENWDV